MKIWSLLPSATEILFALGLGDEVTGVTHECDYAPEANRKPRVTISYIDSSQTCAVPGVAGAADAGWALGSGDGGPGGRESAAIAVGEPSRKVPWRELRALSPEVIVLMPCGFGSERAVRESGVLWDLEGWRRLPAVRKGEVYAVDGNSYFSRPGPRLLDGIEILAHILHPQRWPQTAAPGTVFRLISPPAGASSVENWPSRFEPYS